MTKAKPTKTKSFKSNSKPRKMEVVRQKIEETTFEAECRKLAGFPGVEEHLGRRWSISELPAGDLLSSRFGFLNPFTKAADAESNKVWLLDNTAYRPVHPYPHDPQPWQAEFVACLFKTGNRDVSHIISTILDQIGLDGKLGTNDEVRKRIEERIYPFVDQIAPARTIKVEIPDPTGTPAIRTLGPTNSNGISSQIELTGGSNSVDGKVVDVVSHEHTFPSLLGKMRYAGPDGWGICSDIDDTIKITQTVDPIGTLRNTFAEIPKTTPGLPEFYKILDAQFNNPAFFYLSASPYNLYPFLHKFLAEHYPHGTMILRDNSWMYFGGLLQALTQGVQAYKVDRMIKIHSWLPNRKFICIGDSTQKDPESYAEIYKKFPGWIHAIYIRKVTDAPYMEEKNKPDRFAKAFEGVPASAWRLFEKPDELADHVKHVAGSAHMGIVGALEKFFCREDHAHGETKTAAADTKATPSNETNLPVIHEGSQSSADAPKPQHEGAK